MGEFEHNIDAKGRLFMPAKLRESLGKHFVVTKGVDGCLDVYPLTEWEKLKNSFAQKMMPKQKERDVSRFIFGGAVEAEPDKQGRILLPVNLRSYAKLDVTALIVGVGAKAEIWDVKRYAEYNAKVEKDVVELVEELDFE
ncbi:MAG: division/cell wall cluster transcriptional repressor MraZ [Acidaminococcaceae bacterium]|jgi:MraZ protein|nr:division/cell wall cluster transcriptional repressor MraZ [Acidaminococcaceae bacterium]